MIQKTCLNLLFLCLVFNSAWAQNHYNQQNQHNNHQQTNNDQQNPNDDFLAHQNME